MAQNWNAWAKNWGTSWGSSWGPLEIAPNGERSGYWRMMLAQMQQESLDADKEKTKDAVVAEKKVIFKVVDKLESLLPEKKKARRKDAKPRIQVVNERPVLRRVTASPTEQDLTPLLNIVTNEFRAWILQIEPLRVKMLQQVAANDEEEEDIELLLLAA